MSLFYAGKERKSIAVVLSVREHDRFRAVDCLHRVRFIPGELNHELFIEALQGFVRVRSVPDIFHGILQQYPEISGSADF